MKKLIILFLLLPFFVTAQIQMSQVNGLIPKLNSKQDSLVSGVNIKTINGSSIKGSGNLSIVAGGGGAGANVYLSDVNSSVSGYKTSSPNIDASESVKTITASTPNTVYWGEKYLYTSPIATTNIPSGLWGLHVFGNVNSAVGVSSVVFRIFKYSGSTETVLFTFTGYEVDNIEASEIIVTGGGTETTLLPTDYLGIQVGFQTTAATAKTLTYTIGNGHASYSTNPLPLRHDGLRDKNGNNDYLHATLAQINYWNGKQNQISGTGFVKASGTTLSYDNNTYSTDIHSNITALNDVSGSNHGDETLTSVKTKLGAANSTTDGYIKYQDWNIFNGKQSALGFTPEQQLTFGTGLSRTGNTITNSFTAFKTVNSVSVVGNGDISINPFPGFGTSHSTSAYGDHNHSGVYRADLKPVSGAYFQGTPIIGADGVMEIGKYIDFHDSNTDASDYTYRLTQSGSDLSGSGSISAISFSGSGAGLTGFTSSQITTALGFTPYNATNPNGYITSSSLSNYVNKTGDVMSGALRVGTSLNDYQLDIDAASGGRYSTLSFKNNNVIKSQIYWDNMANLLNFSGASTFSSSVTATSFYGSGSSLTGVQLPITLTTNGTSGDATFSGNVLNVPNYSGQPKYMFENGGVTTGGASMESLYDFFWVCRNSSPITMNLPSSPRLLQCVYIRTSGAGSSVLVNGNGHQLWNDSAISSLNLDTGAWTYMFVYDSTYWVVTRMHY